jgi:hypothetical protein
VILRLAGVLSVDLGAMPLSMDAPFLENALPTDGRIHTIDVRDDLGDQRGGTQDRVKVLAR